MAIWKLFFRDRVLPEVLTYPFLTGETKRHHVWHVHNLFFPLLEFSRIYNKGTEPREQETSERTDLHDAKNLPNHLKYPPFSLVLVESY